MKSLYLKLYFVLSAILISGSAGLNALVDPLWYGKGNQLDDYNFYFNERVSKTNLFLQSNPEDYDCLIIGSSRVTSLRPSSFEAHNCFNFAFDGGKIEDYVAYAAFAREKGLNPDIIYVGVDALNFWESRLPPNLPEEPQPMYQAYLSADVLLFSVKTLLKRSPSPRYYDTDFEGEIVEGLPPYRPYFMKSYRSTPKLAPERVAMFEDLREVFPEAKYVGFVPPVSAWNLVNAIYGPGFMESYFDSQYQVSGLFDEMYDFSSPSYVTKDPANSYDSGHYYANVQTMIADTLEGRESTFEIVVNQQNFDEYREEYVTRIERFLAEQNHVVTQVAD